MAESINEWWLDVLSPRFWSMSVYPNCWRTRLAALSGFATAARKGWRIDVRLPDKASRRIANIGGLNHESIRRLVLHVQAEL